MSLSERFLVGALGSVKAADWPGLSKCGELNHGETTPPSTPRIRPSLAIRGGKLRAAIGLPVESKESRQSLIVVSWALP